MITEQLDLRAKSLPDFEQIQQEHYERIANVYDLHYNDVYSQQYFREVVFEPMFSGIELENKSVLEAMCGGGQTAKYLTTRHAKVTGLDISPQQVAHFKNRHPEANVICASMLNSGIPSESVDVVSVVGGIHHMPPNVNESIREIHRVLKPGGYFCFMEPHSESFAETFRRIWYKCDSLFAENEEALNMGELRKTFSGKFDFKKELYLGNLGYLFVLNSLVFRIPHKLKPLYSPFLIRIERILNKILGKRFSCFVAAQWQKK